MRQPRVTATRARSRASSPCMTAGCSAKVEERRTARQTRSPVIDEIVPQLGRLATPVPSPNSCQSLRRRELVSARSGRVPESRRSRSLVNPELPVHVGIDVSKATLDVAIEPTHERWQLPNDQAGIEQLVERLGHLRPERVVLEAT